MSGSNVQRHLLAAAYARLEEADRLGQRLIEDRSPEQVRVILDEIVAVGSETLQQVGSFADPYLLSHTQMSLAAAHADLAGLAPSSADQKELLYAAVERCEIAIALALDSDVESLMAEILPWAIVVLTRMLGQAEGLQREALQARLSTATRELTQAMQAQRKGQLRGQQTLQTAYYLAAAGRELDGQIEREAVLNRAQKQAEAAVQTLVQSGDFLLAGEAQAFAADLQVALEIEPEKEAGEEKTAVEAEPGTDTVLVGSNWQLIVIRGLGVGQVYPLGETTRLGREPAFEIWLSDPKVSRRHAVFERQGGVYRVTDLGSSNGTFVNGERISQPTYLQPGDVIRVGDVQFAIQQD